MWGKEAVREGDSSTHSKSSINISTLSCVKEITSGELLKGSSLMYSVMTLERWDTQEEREIYIYICIHIYTYNN